MKWRFPASRFLQVTRAPRPGCDRNIPYVLIVCTRISPILSTGTALIGKPPCRKKSANFLLPDFAGASVHWRRLCPRHGCSQRSVLSCILPSGQEGEQQEYRKECNNPSGFRLCSCQQGPDPERTYLYCASTRRYSVVLGELQNCRGDTLSVSVTKSCTRRERSCRAATNFLTPRHLEWLLGITAR